MLCMIIFFGGGGGGGYALFACLYIIDLYVFFLRIACFCMEFIERFRTLKSLYNFECPEALYTFAIIIIIVVIIQS